MFERIKPALGAGGLALVMAVPSSFAADDPAVRQEVTKDGITVAMTIAPANADGVDALRATDPLAVAFALRDANTGAPLKGLTPKAWIDLQKGGQEAASCTEKVRSWLGGRLAFRPEVELNQWHMVTLNREPTLSVLDPMVGLSKTKLLALVRLDAPGSDWAATRDGERLFVSVPDAGHVAVVETLRWTIQSRIKVADRPQRLVPSPDGQRLWVGHEGGAVTAIDTATLTVAATAKVGNGVADVALSDDQRFALGIASGNRDATLFDGARLSTLGAVPLEGTPVGAAWSPLAKAFYVADGNGTITVIDPETVGSATAGRRATIRTEPETEQLAMAPGGRFVLALNPGRSLVQVVDTAANRVIHTLPVEGAPDQAVFTKDYAYLRLRGSGRVAMLHLDALEPGGSPRVSFFTAGQTPPGAAPGPRTHAATLAPSPEPASMLVANPKDGVIFYYMEGMNAPSGSFRAFRHEIRAVTSVDRGLRETAPGTYAATAALPAPGRYDVAVLLDRPRLLHCFTLDVAPSAGAGAEAAPLPLRVDYMVPHRVIPPGQEVPLRFRLDGDPRRDMWRDAQDVNLLTTLSPGVWQARLSARPVGDGTYEVGLTLPQEGLYYLYLESPSLDIRADSLPYLVLHGRKEATP